MSALVEIHEHGSVREIRLARPPVNALNTELCLRGGVERLEGRKTFVRAEIHADEVLTASCDGVFVQPHGGMHGLHQQHAQSTAG